MDGRPWVTRFEQRDAVPVDDPAAPSEHRFPVSGESGIHDGHLHEGSICETSDGLPLYGGQTGGGRKFRAHDKATGEILAFGSLLLEGTPVRVEFRSDENPFKGKRNPLTPRQRRSPGSATRSARP